jgi:hypothetical protein
MKQLENFVTYSAEGLDVVRKVRSLSTIALVTVRLSTIKFSLDRSQTLSTM